MKKYFIYFLISLSGVIVTSCNNDTESRKKVSKIRPVKTVTVPNPEQEISKNYPGIVDADQKSMLSFLVGGKLVKLNVKTGDEVKKGDVIAELDNRDYKNDYQASLARKQEAEADLKRSKELLEKGVETLSTYEKKLRDYTVSVNDLSVKHKALSDTQLKAPFSGIISKRYIDNFEDVNAKQTIVLLQDISTLNVIINVPEDIVKKYQKDSDKSLFFASFSSVDSRRFPLKIKEYSTESDQVTKTYEVIFSMKPVSGLSIYPGMTTTVEQVTPLENLTANSYFKLPVSAIAKDEVTGNSFCWVVNRSTLKVNKRIVKILTLAKDSAIVSSGLSSGEVVVSAGTSYLLDGQQVKILKK